MDVTLTKPQIVALEKFLDALIGEEPSKLDHGHAANARRYKRQEARNFMHRYAALSMKIGAERARAALGLQAAESAMPVWKDPKTGAETIMAPVPDGKEGVVIARKH